MSDTPMQIAERVLEMVGSRAEAQVIVTVGTSALTRFANSYIHQNVAEDTDTVAIKVAVDGRPAAGSTNRTDDETIRRLVEHTLEGARLRPVDPYWPGLTPPSVVPSIEHWDQATAEADPEARASVVEAFVAADRRLLSAGYCETSATTRVYANSSGQRLAGRATAATVQGIHQTPDAEGGAQETSAALGRLDGASLGARSADMARRGVDATVVPAGRYEVVLGPACVANMLLFLRAGFDGRAVSEGRSFAHLGDIQFDSKINLWDDIADSRALGYAFDGEGTPKRRIDLVREGRTTALYYDRSDAARVGGGAVSTGGVPMNLFLDGTSRTGVDEMIAAVERGLFVNNFHYTRILDPKTQVVTGLTRGGVWSIESGQLRRSVQNLRFTQSFAGALGPGKVLGVGDDGRLLDGSWVPTLHLATWNFTGNARG